MALDRDKPSGWVRVDHRSLGRLSEGTRQYNGGSLRGRRMRRWLERAPSANFGGGGE